MNDRDKTKDQLINELAELRKQVEKLKASASKYKQAEILFKAQCDLGISLSSIHKLKETLRLCVDSAISISGMDCGGVYLVDDSGNLDMPFHIGLPPAFVKSSSHYDADSASARLVMAGNPIYSKHHELGISLDKTREKEHLKAIAVVPVLHKDKVIACLNIASHTVDEVPDYARTALEAIASQIGNSIIRSKMEEALKRRFTEMFGYTKK
jgi:GAF domain-containing protein